MMMIRPPPGQIYYVCFILFCSFTVQVATLQNITVDDAVLTGAVVPTYLPSPSDWNVGNDCSVCYVKPNSSGAYNGTWHDVTFFQQGTVFPELELIFEGSGLYIYFILAPYLPYAITNTNVIFYLDGVRSSSFLYASTSADYEYNQAVYANDSIPYGQHTMLVTPVNDTVNSVLMLFDYFIYTTTDTDSTTTVTTGQVPSITQSPSGSSTTSSGPNVGAIVGGVIGGIGALSLVTVSLLCYRRYKRRVQHSSAEVTQSLTPFEASPLRNQQMLVGFPRTANPGLTSKSTAPPVSAQSTNTTSNVTASGTQLSPSASPSHTTEVLEQVVLLRDEVARLHRFQDQNRNVADSELGSELLPEYS